MNLVVYVDPMANPDGRERTLAHVTAYSRLVPTPDRQDFAHNPIWPPNRFNHHFMDLNRDALFVTQPQSAARVRSVMAVRPQLFLDAHEMFYSSNHLFAVPAEPFNPHIPAEIHEGWEQFAAALAEPFDQRGRSFYTRSWNEVIYPGYYDILPAYSGITPVLLEQGGTSGVAVELPNGTTRSFSDAVDNQLQSSWAALTSAASNRDRLIERWLSARHRTAYRIADQGPKAWILPADDSYKIKRLRNVLDVHGIRYEVLGSSTRIPGLRPTWGAQSSPPSLPPGSVLVRAAQPLAGLVRNLFDVHIPMSEAFLRAERGRLDLGQKPQIYDITAWSLPLAFGLDAYWTRSVPGGKWQAPGDAPAFVPTPVQAARYGYLYRDPSLFTTTRLLQKGVKVRVGMLPFSRGNETFGEGTFLVRLEEQSQDVLAALAAESEREGVLFHALDGARANTGPDLGDDSFMLLTRPRIGLFSGPSTLATSVGAIWQMFDQEIGVPLTLLDVTRLQTFDLRRYDVLVVPDAEDPQRLASFMRGPAAEMLKSWVRQGGTLLLEGAAVRAAAEAGLTGLTPRLTVIERQPPLMFGRSAVAAGIGDFLVAAGTRSQAEPVEKPEVTRPVLGEAARTAPGAPRYFFRLPERGQSFEDWAGGEAEAKAMSSVVGTYLGRYLPKGAYLRADMKPRHWLRFGAGDRLPVLFKEADAIVAPPGTEVVGRFARPQDLALSGLIWPESVGYIAETAFLARERLGRGQVIAFSNDPAYRGYSLGTQRLLMNAMILGPGMLFER
jgi:hypothetical protein